jgi:hypothetical protein
VAMKRALVFVGALAGATAAYGLVLRRWHLRWGATDREVGAALPGDGLIAAPDLVSTRAITIAAPADEVWPWLAQLGAGRGGFYSYDLLENVFGRCDIHSAGAIVPEWQAVEVGDAVHLHPDMALTVALVQPGSALVLSGGVPVSEEEVEEPEAAEVPFAFTWAFVLQEAPGGATRLVMRERYRYLQPWAGAIVEPVEAVSFLMSQKMLRGIRDRAER